MQARLDVDEAAATATVSWRFERPPAEPGITGITAFHNGRPLSMGALRGYPMEGDATAALFVVDLTGAGARYDDILESKTLIFEAVGSFAPHHRFGFGGIDSDLLIATGTEEAPVEPFTALAALQPSEHGQALLFGALGMAMEQIGAVPASRHSVFVFTDGYSDEEINYDVLREVASETGVALIVCVLPSDRPADLAPLERLALESGGAYHEGVEAVGLAMQEPFVFIDSGGSADFDLGEARRYFWDAGNRLDAVIEMGEAALVLVTDVPVPDASLDEAVAYLWNHHGNVIGFSLAGVGWAAALVLLPFAARRRPGVVAKNDAVAPASAPASGSSGQVKTSRPLPSEQSWRLTWTDPASRQKTGFAVSAQRVTIGRASDNVIVISDDTVSSHQAVFVREDDGSYSVVNLSATNATTVDYEPVQSRLLRGGERIGIGQIEARFEM